LVAACSVSGRGGDAQGGGVENPGLRPGPHFHYSGMQSVMFQGPVAQITELCFPNVFLDLKPSISEETRGVSMRIWSLLWCVEHLGNRPSRVDPDESRPRRHTVQPGEQAEPRMRLRAQQRQLAFRRLSSAATRAARSWRPSVGKSAGSRCRNRDRSGDCCGTDTAASRRLGSVGLGSRTTSLGRPLFYIPFT
jgi:hypothetical protein